MLNVDGRGECRSCASWIPVNTDGELLSRVNPYDTPPRAPWRRNTGTPAPKYGACHTRTSAPVYGLMPLLASPTGLSASSRKRRCDRGESIATAISLRPEGGPDSRASVQRLRVGWRPKVYYSAPKYATRLAQRPVIRQRHCR